MTRAQPQRVFQELPSSILLERKSLFLVQKLELSELGKVKAYSHYEHPSNCKTKLICSVTVLGVLKHTSVVVDGVENGAVGRDESYFWHRRFNQLCAVSVNETSIVSLASKLIEDRSVALLGIARLT